MSTLKDIFKKSFLEGYASGTIDVTSVIAAIAISALIGLYIFLVYRVITRKAFYSKTFNISLVGVSMITAAIIVTIQSSVVVSLGMVGALSIVRFRTAVKEPMDLMFMFWSISTGIICGAGFAEYAVVLALALTVGILILDRVPVAKAPMILVVNAGDLDAEAKIMEVVEKYSAHSNVKSRNMTAAALDMVIEVRTHEGSSLVREMMRLECVNSASLLSHDGEVTF